MKRLTIFTLIAVFAAVTTGCATDEYGNPLPMTDAEKGAIIGAASGAVVGAMANKDNRSKGALIGAVGGGIAGGAVGTYMDSQKKDLEKVLVSEVQAGVINIQKVNQNDLLITMTSQTAFDFDSTVIKPGFYSTMVRFECADSRQDAPPSSGTRTTSAPTSTTRPSEHRAQVVNDYLRNRACWCSGPVPRPGETAPRAATPPRKAPPQPARGDHCRTDRCRIPESSARISHSSRRRRTPCPMVCSFHIRQKRFRFLDWFLSPLAALIIGTFQNWFGCENISP
jgi:outer membrane protein OmpA-like peptidoglycan-associated protein